MRMYSVGITLGTGMVDENDTCLECHVTQPTAVENCMLPPIFGERVKIL